MVDRGGETNRSHWDWGVGFAYQSTFKGKKNSMSEKKAFNGSI